MNCGCVCSGRVSPTEDAAEPDIDRQGIRIQGGLLGGVPLDPPTLGGVELDELILR